LQSPEVLDLYFEWLIATDVQSGVTFSAQRDQVVFGIAAGVAAKLLMMDFQIVP